MILPPAAWGLEIKCLAHAKAPLENAQARTGKSQKGTQDKSKPDTEQL